jgi:RpiR family carbohydrate utilization transcriptional regulator
MMRAVQGAIEDTKNKLDILTLNKSVQMLSNADRIDFCGAGKSGIIAKLAHHKFFLLGVPCTAYSEPYMQAMAAYMVSSNSATVVISATGVTRTTIECAKAARESGATVIGVIGPEKSKLAHYCDAILPVYSREAAMWFAPQTTRIIQIAILDALFVSVAIRKFGSVKENLEEVNKEVFSY